MFGGIGGGLFADPPTCDVQRNRCKGFVLSALIRTVAETGSTNADLLALASDAPDGLWLRAETQSAGRGRHGRGWQSPLGNLYVSHLVKLRLGDPPAATLAIVAAVALAETCRSLAPHIAFTLKWPNDVLVGDAKLSGILLERTGNAVVIGFGVNLGFHPVGLDRPVTSFPALGLERPDPGHFCADLAECFAIWLARWREEGVATARSAWLALAHREGTPLIAHLSNGASVEGVFAGLDNDCALLLRLADGSRRAIHAGDVFLV